MRIILLLILLVEGLSAQPPVSVQPPTKEKISGGLNYGVSLDARLELVYKYGYLTNLRIGVAGGAGYYLNDNFMPYSQMGISLFQGGIGSSISVSQRNRINLEMNNAVGIIGGIASGHVIHRPVYTMGKFISNPIKHPYSYYLNLSTTFIQRISKNQKPSSRQNGRFSQRVGAAALGLGQVEINYYNDGMPYHFLGLGDNKDRYYTGGGFINFTTNYNPHKIPVFVDDIYVGFDRFTGFFPESFELAYSLHLNEVPYKDLTQAYYNKGRFFVGTSFRDIKGLNTFVSLNDFDELDVQYLIHLTRKQPLHRTLHKSNIGFNAYYTSPLLK